MIAGKRLIWRPRALQKSVQAIQKSVVRYTITKLAEIGSGLQNSTHSCDWGILAETTARLVEILTKVPQFDSLRAFVSYMMLW